MRTEDLERSQLQPRVAGGAAGLVIVDSPDGAIRQRFFPLAGEIRLGRREDDRPASAARIDIADPRISREHVTLRFRSDGTGCEVRDLSSRNGTFLDGRRITCEVAPLGSVLRAGDTFVEIAVEPVPVLPDPILRGRSAALCRLLLDIERVASADVNLLVEGETGAGKELVAEVVHARSGRAGPLVAMNCASVPAGLAESWFFGHRKGAFTGAGSDAEGVFDQARDGTLFLDEVAELPLDIQAKLLRVLETRQFVPVGASTPRSASARFVFATNARLRAHVAAGTFREDLYARVAGVEIQVPPLRQRRSDIPLLLAGFLEQHGAGGRFELSANAMQSLLQHPWPMNVRELTVVARRLALARPAGGLLRSADVAAALSEEVAAGSAPRGDPPEGASAPTRVELSDLMKQHRGNVVQLATHYGKDRRQIYRWLRVRGLDPRDFR